MAKSSKKKRSSKGGGAAAWFKENPGQAKLVVLGVLLAVLAVVLAWSMLGGSSGSRPTRSESARTPEAEPDTAAPPPPPAPVQQEKSGEESGGVDKAAGEQTAPEQPPNQQQSQQPGMSLGMGEASVSAAGAGNRPPAPENASANAAVQSERPDDVSAWKMADYFSAKAENDSRLIEAVAQLGQRFAGSPKAGRVAEILAELLAPPKKEQGDGQQQSTPGGTKSGELIKTLVAALGENGSDTARKALEQLLAGELPTEDDKAAALAALQALAGNPSEKNDDVLFRVLTAAEDVRPADRGKVTAEELREEACSLVESGGSERLRLKLAEHVVEAGAGEESQATLMELLEQNHPDNLAAQLVLYRGENTDDETKATLEELFTAHSSESMAKMLGVTAEVSNRSGYQPRQRGGTRRPGSISTNSERPRSTNTRQPPTGRNQQATETKETDPDLPYRLARHLWGPESVSMLQDRLAKVESFEEQTQIVALAATVPVDSMRSALLEAMAEHWDDGPKDLESAGLSDKLVCDPGVVLVVKALCHKPPAKRAMGKDAMEKFQETKEAWGQFSDDLVLAWCERFHAAALARVEAAEETKRESSDGNPMATLPIRLHEDAKVAAEYHLSFPGEARAKLSGVAAGTLEIHYVRIEEKARRKTRLGYYKRQLKARAGDVRQLEEDVDWLESFRNVPEGDRRRSIDVVISPAEKDQSGRSDDNSDDEKKEEDEDLIVEVLSIETKDPAKG